jgi:membrane protein implicated in regulation of membrane protease activity
VVSLTDLLEWWNIIFALPLGVGLLLMTAIALSGLADIMLEHGDFSHDMGGDAAHAVAAHEVGDAAHGEFHHDTGDVAHGDASEVSSDTADGGEGHTEAHDAHDGDSSPSSHAESKDAPLLLKVLQLFGIGAGLPITLAIPLLLVLWGGVGLIANQVLQPLLRLPALFFPLSAVASLAVMMLTGRTAARVARRLFYTRRPTAVRRGGLIGCEGYAVYTITEEGGVAQVRDPFGNRHRIVCRIPPGETPLPPDTPLIVSRYDEEERLYIVEPHPFATPPRHTQSPDVPSIQHIQRGG